MASTSESILRIFFATLLVRLILIVITSSSPPIIHVRDRLARLYCKCSVWRPGYAMLPFLNTWETGRQLGKCRFGQLSTKLSSLECNTRRNTHLSGDK